MIEVEIRAQVKNFDRINNALAERGGQFVETNIQVDAIYGRPRDMDAERKIKEGGLAGRLRQIGPKLTLEFKEIASDRADFELNIELSDDASGKKFLAMLDFEEIFTIRKSREVYLLDGFTICLDDVVGLGKFIGIEKIIDTVSGSGHLQEECAKLLAQLDPDALIEPKKYGDLMQEIINKQLKRGENSPSLPEAEAPGGQPAKEEIEQMEL